MRPITFSKAIILKNMLLGIENIYIENEFHYSNVGNDLKINGIILIKFLANDGLSKKEQEEKIDVDCLLSLGKIDCQKDLELRFKDYKVVMDEHLLKFYVNYDLVGNGEKVLSFQEVAEDIKEEKIINAMNKELEEKLDKESIEKIKEMLDKEDVEVISSVPLVEEKEAIIEEEKIIPEKEEEKKEVEKTKPIKKEDYVVAYFFYKVNEGETYSSIADKFKIPLEEIKKINKDEELYAGKLLRLKK